MKYLKYMTNLNKYIKFSDIFTVQKYNFIK